MKESQAQAAICEYLAYQKLFFWRNNNIPVFADGTFRAMPKYARKGVPDILLLINGKFIGLEVKSLTGIMSEHQKEFEADMQNNGGYYYVIRSIDDVQKILEDF